MDDRERFRLIAQDRDQIKCPVLTPHLEYRLIEEGTVLLVSETFNTLLHGKLYSDLLALLDGIRSHNEVKETLCAVYSESEVSSALAALANKGYIVSGDYRMERQQAAFWSSLGANPHRVEKKLESSTIAVRGNNTESLAQALHSMGVRTDTSSASLTVYTCIDFLDSQFEEINQSHIESGRPWVLIRPQGMHPLLSPVFHASKGSPCWACLSHRLANHQEVHSYLRNQCGENAAYIPHASQPAVMTVVYSMAAVELAKWLVLEESAPLHTNAITLDIKQFKASYHPVFWRPQCSFCGDEELRRPDRQPVPLRLNASPVNSRNSGGIRAVSPGDTLERYRHLVSPVSGVVTWLERTTAEHDPWLHVHWAGSNLALRIKSLSSLRRSLRSKSAGKGSTREQSEVSALCEAVERYSFAFHGDEIRFQKCMNNFLAEGEEAAIHPNDVQLFSEVQFDQAKQINERGHPFNVVPPRFRPERQMDWSPVWSFTQNRHRYMPTAMLYGMTPQERGTAGLWADSNGCASGNTLEEAILQGFLELVERDAFAIWWYNRLHRAAVDLTSFGDVYLASAVKYYQKYQRDMWVLDVTSDLGIPVFVAISRRNNHNTEDIIFGAGAHIDPKIAVLRAVCEMNQCLTMVPRPGADSPGYTVDDPLCLWWWKNVKTKDHRYLEPAAGVTRTIYDDYRLPDTEDVRDDVTWCRELIESKGMEFLTLDQTRPDIGMPVVRVIVPGLRHFWQRLAPGRLYDVPVEMGWKTHAADEADLNPVPVVL